VKQSVYIETSIVSYLVARPSRDLVAAGRGDTDAARQRIGALADTPILPLTPDVDRVAAALLKGAALPERAAADATHIALAIAHRVDYLLTWSCKHIANPFIQRYVQRISAEAGFIAPVVCTPEEFVGG